jgi:hypothetical protein
MSFIIGRIKESSCVEACIAYLQKRFDKGYVFFCEYSPKEEKHLVSVKITEDETEDNTETIGGMIEVVFAFNEGYKQGYEASADYHAQESAGDNI